MEPLSIALSVGIAVLTLTAIVLHLLRKDTLLEEWAAVAAKLDLGPAKGGLGKRFPSFRSFSVGHSRQTRLLESPDGEVLLGNYSFETDNNLVVQLLALHSRTHEFSICVLKTPGLDLPCCLLRRQGVADSWEKLFGQQDFDFADDPDFSKAFVLQGHDEADVRARFDGRTREWLVKHRSSLLRIEAYRDTLAFFAPQAGPKQLEQVLQEARELLSLWR